MQQKVEKEPHDQQCAVLTAGTASLGALLPRDVVVGHDFEVARSHQTNALAAKNFPPHHHLSSSK